MTRTRLISLLGLLATISVVLVGVAGPSQAAGTVTPSIGLPGSQTATKDDDTLRLGGAVGPNAQSVISASLKVVGPNNNQIGPTIDRTSKTSVSGGTIVGGQYILDRNNFRNAPTDNYLDAHGGKVVFEVTVRFSDGPSTGSTAVPIDLHAPVMDAASLRRTSGGQAREIEVKFSEPVIHPDGGDLPSDWRIQDQNTAQLFPVDSVCCHTMSDRRILTLTTDANEDSVLLVDFTPTQVGRNDYVDKAGNFLGTRPGPNGGECQCRLATDDIPPALPTIEQIAGKPGANVAGNDSTPTVRVGNVNNGNTAQVYLETNPGANPTWSPLEDQLVGQATADATRRADVTISDLGGDGPYILWGVARDAAGNTSNGGARGDYRLDRVAPRGLAAGTNGNTLDVFVTEPIIGARIATNWRVTPPGLPPAEVTGGDGTDHRLLRLPTGQTADCATVCPNVNWDGLDSTATDRAGNTMPNFTLTAQNALAPFARITRPEGEVWEKAATYTIQGTVANFGSSISVFADTDDDEVADNPGSPVATAPVSNQAFSVQVPLNTGARVPNNFVVNATRTDITPARTGPYVDVPTIIQDNVDPVVTVQSPAGGELLAGGGTFEVRWQASDEGGSAFAAAPLAAAFGTEPITIEYSVDGGAQWHQAKNAADQDQPAGREPNDGSFTWRVPDENSTQALIRVTAEDRALRTGMAQSGPFTIDADNPFFGAETKDFTHVSVQFSEPIKGFVNALEWRIDGVVAKSVSPSGSQNGIRELTLETVTPFGRSATPQITYSPLSPTAQAQLTDIAGNQIAPTSARASDGIPPTAPTVIDPTGPVLTGQDAHQIKGAAEEGSLVTVYRDDGNNGTPDVIVGTQQLDPAVGAYDVRATLLDGPNHLLVTATDAAGNESPARPVPTITADLVPPVVTILSPTAGQLVGGGDSSFTVRWIATDVNLTTNSIKIEYSTDGGASYKVVGENEANDGEFSFALPNEAVKSARVRVSATDAYGRVGSATSGPFEILVCEIFGTNGNDVLIGTDQGETICSYDGDDLVNGRGGNDTILSGEGRKRIDAGSGDDRVEGGPADDLIRGRSGDDEINARGGNDKAYGDEGKDLLIGHDGNDGLRGGSGNDRFLGQAGNDKLLGDSGSDNLNGGEGNDTVAGGTGNDDATGELGNDRLVGNTGNDDLDGGDGNDRLTGSAGDDRLDGGKGKDRLSGGSGNDRLAGGPGKDKCKPGSGANVVRKKC